jgi:glycolate oxidase FAD binding subunit
MRDAFASLPLHQPATVAELGDLVRQAAAAKQAIYPLGGGTRLDFGLPPAQPGWVVATTALNRVIDYPARDMTITVQAGITLARLQEVLAAEGQRLPVDVPQPALATLGGAVATNASGPRRYGHGTLRDYVIGLSAVNDAGEEIKAGGRVVKNVAGYDLCKLYTGSLGTLGVITQLTLKVRPRPEAGALVGLRATDAELAPLLERLHATATRPVAIEALRPAGALADLPADRWLVLVGFEDNAEAVGWQMRQLRQEVGAAEVATWEGAAAGPVWEALAEGGGGEGVVIKAAVRPSQAAAFGVEAAARGARVQAQAGNGIVWGRLAEEVTREQAQAVVQYLRGRAAEGDGSLVVVRCPLAWKTALGVWGPSRGDWELMRQVKRALDPQGIFNPGRFIGGS